MRRVICLHNREDDRVVGVNLDIDRVIGRVVIRGDGTRIPVRETEREIVNIIRELRLARG